MITARMGTATTRPARPKSLPEQKDTGDREHGRQIHLPLHDHRRNEVGLDEVDAHTDPGHGQCLGQAGTPSAMRAGMTVLSRVPKNGTIAAMPAKTPKARK